MGRHTGLPLRSETFLIITTCRGRPMCRPVNLNYKQIKKRLYAQFEIFGKRDLFNCSVINLSSME